MAAHHTVTAITRLRNLHLRRGLAGLLVFLGVNGVRLCWTNDEAFDFIMAIADGHLDDVDAIAIAIASRNRGGQESSGE